jgi:hypothetical protein
MGSKTAPEDLASFAALSDDELVERVKHLAACERRATAAVIRSLVEFDSRKLYLREGCSSLYTIARRSYICRKDLRTTVSKQHARLGDIRLSSTVSNAAISR